MYTASKGDTDSLLLLLSANADLDHLDLVLHLFLLSNSHSLSLCLSLQNGHSVFDHAKHSVHADLVLSLLLRVLPYLLSSLPPLTTLLTMTVT
jgi:hypothetical protein